MPCHAMPCHVMLCYVTVLRCLPLILLYFLSFPSVLAFFPSSSPSLHSIFYFSLPNPLPRSFLIFSPTYFLSLLLFHAPFLSFSPSHSPSLIDSLPLFHFLTLTLSPTLFLYRSLSITPFFSPSPHSPLLLPYSLTPSLSLYLDPPTSPLFKQARSTTDTGIRGGYVRSPTRTCACACACARTHCTHRKWFSLYLVSCPL